MSEFFEYAVALSSIAATASLLSFSAGRDKFHRFAVSAVLASALAVPFLNLVGQIGELDFSSASFKEEEIESVALGSTAETAFTEGIRAFVAEEWSVSKEKIIVSAEGFDFQNMRAEKIKITLLGRGAHIDFRALSDYIESKGLGECEVFYAIK